MERNGRKGAPRPSCSGRGLSDRTSSPNRGSKRRTSSSTPLPLVFLCLSVTLSDSVSPLFFLFALMFIQVDYGNEFFMVNRAFKAIRRADVVLLMVDVEAGITDQVNARHVVFCKLFISDRQLRVSPPHQSAVLVSHHNTLWISFAAAIGAPCAHSDLFPWTGVGAARQL